MNQYGKFAYIYDELMQDVDYKEIVDFAEEIFKQELKGKKPELILDMACGTGTITNELSLRGYDMIGIDMSEDMLQVAAEKAVAAGLDKTLFLCQDMRELDLYGTVDVVMCMIDSLNYITKYEDIKKIFSLVHNFLNPDGLFIFDMNTIHKLSKVLGENTFTYSTENITYIWENEYDIRKKMCEFYLTFFVREGELYRKFEECHVEKGYALEAIEEALSVNGFELIGKYDGYSFNEGNRNCERVTFVARAIK